MTKKVMSIRAPDDAIRRAIEVYDLQLTDHPAEAVDEVEEILGLNGIEWQWQSFRHNLIRDIFDRINSAHSGTIRARLVFLSMIFKAC